MQEVMSVPQEAARWVPGPSLAGATFCLGESLLSDEETLTGPNGYPAQFTRWKDGYSGPVPVPFLDSDSQSRGGGSPAAWRNLFRLSVHPQDAPPNWLPKQH